MVHTILVTFIWYRSERGFELDLFRGMLWLPIRILYSYPLMYWVLPQFLLKGKYIKFGIIILLWAIAGWFLNYFFRAYLFIPVQEYFHLDNIDNNPWQPNSFLVLTITAGITCIIVLFKHWFRKQQEWMQAERKK